MSADAFAHDLHALGVCCRVEARDRLAVLLPLADADPLTGFHGGGEVPLLAAVADDALRRRVVALAAEHGFTHVALELAEDGEALRRD